MKKPKLFRITTVPISLEKLLTGQLKFMSSYFSVTAISSDEKKLKKIALREDSLYFPLKLTREITPILDILAVLKLYRIFKIEKPLIVHTHTPKAGTVGMLAAKLAGVPLRLHTVAGLPLLEAVGNKRRLLNLVEKATYACATMIYPNSYGLKEIILTHKFTQNRKLKVIGNGSSNGIDTNYFDSDHFAEGVCLKLRSDLKINQKDLVFVFVGRLVGDKGINELIEAFETVSKSRSNCKLLLVGSLETELDPLREDTLLKISEDINIISVGFQNDVRPYLAISDILVFPSYREGFPNVVMQAGAMGLPAIVTNINGCNEIILEGKNGTIIPSKNVPKLEKAMFKMIDNQEYRLSLKLNARPMICSRYEQQVVWEAILQEYQTLIQNLPNRAH